MCQVGVLLCGEAHANSLHHLQETVSPDVRTTDRDFAVCTQSPHRGPALLGFPTLQASCQAPHLRSTSFKPPLISSRIPRQPLVLRRTRISTPSRFTARAHVSSPSSPQWVLTAPTVPPGPHGCEPPLPCGPSNLRSRQSLSSNIRAARAQGPTWVRSTQNNVQGASHFPPPASLYPFFPSPVSDLLVSVCMEG